MDVRVAPAPPAELGPLARLVAWGAGRVTRGEPPRIFLTLGRHRRLLRSWLPFAGTLLFRTRLARADTELVVLRTAVNCSSPYEWAQHVALARRVGVGADVVDAVPDWRRSEVLTPRQRLLLTATDELHGHRVVGDATWAQLSDALEQDECIELCMLVGHYEMLAMTLNSLGVAPEPGALIALDAGPRRTADALQATQDAAAAGDRPAPR